MTLLDHRDRQHQLSDDLLLAHLGHELRTPLSSLQGYSEILVEYLQQDLASVEAQVAAERIHALVCQVSSMIDDLLEMGRITGGPLPIARSRVDLHQVVTAAIRVAQGLPSAPPIVLDSTFTGIIRGDSRRLTRVILNLLTNAVRHAGASDVIDVRIRRNGGDAVIDVEDFGPGIPPEALPRLFDQRYQAGAEHSGSASDRQSHGLGLGLYIAKTIVDAHGGRIEVASRVGLGTRFTVRLPIR